MKYIIIDNIKHNIWIVPISDYKNSHQLKLLFKTYNDIHDLNKYDVKVFKEIPSRFFKNKHSRIEYTNSDMLNTVINEIKEKLK